MVRSHRVNGDSPREACGLVGAWAPGEDVARLAYFGLYALQHRGQESAGIAVSDGHNILVYRELGLVSQVFDERTLATARRPPTRTWWPRSWPARAPTWRPRRSGSFPRCRVRSRSC